MTFDAFERSARRAFEGIPERYLQGVDGLVVRRDALPHPKFPHVFTLGECVTESYPSGWDGPETVRSQVVLYWGSFRALAEIDPRFDWREQTWETLTHELRHHLESLADRDDLRGVDYAMEQSFRRDEGLDFDPAYYRSGDRIGPGAYAVEDDVYVEQAWREADFARAQVLRFAWGGREFEVERPAELGDVHFARIVEGVPSPPYLELALVRRAGWFERLRSWFERLRIRRDGLRIRREGLHIWESEAVAREIGRPSRDRDGLRDRDG